MAKGTPASFELGSIARLPQGSLCTAMNHMDPHGQDIVILID